MWNIDFNGTNLENSVFERSKMIHSDMKTPTTTKNMEIRDSYFFNVNFNGVDFSEIAIGSGNSFAGSDFRNSNLSILHLFDTDFSQKWIRENDGTELYLSGANLSSVLFFQANLTDANLSNVTISYDTIWNEAILKCKNHPICVS